MSEQSDRRGNVLRRVDELGRETTYAYDANNNLLTVTNDLGQTTTYAYDGRGNLTQQVTDEEIITYSWDARNRLCGVLQPGELIEYFYDHNNFRVETVFGGESHRHLWDEFSTYGFSPNASGKYFALTLAGASQFAGANINNYGTFTITQIRVSPAIMLLGHFFYDVGEQGAGWSIHFSDVALVALYADLMVSGERILMIGSR